MRQHLQQRNDTKGCYFQVPQVKDIFQVFSLYMFWCFSHHLNGRYRNNCSTHYSASPQCCPPELPAKTIRTESGNLYKGGNGRNKTLKRGKNINLGPLRQQCGSALRKKISMRGARAPAHHPWLYPRRPQLELPSVVHLHSQDHDQFDQISSHASFMTSISTSQQREEGESMSDYHHRKTTYAHMD